MGTKGYFGFYYKGKYYIVRNQFDSFPSSVGTDLLNEVKEMVKYNKIDEWKMKIESLRLLIHDKDFDALTMEERSFLIHHFDNPFFKKVRYAFSEDSSKFTIDERLSGYCTDNHYQSSWTDNLYHLFKMNPSFTKILNSGFILMDDDIEKTKYDTEYGYILDLDNYTLNCIDVSFGHELKLNIYQLPKSISFLEDVYKS